MAEYRVELEGSAREVYYVQADSEEEAEQIWWLGLLELQEVWGMDVVCVEKVED